MGAIDDLFADTGASQQAVMLAGATDFVGFRQHARRLLAANVTPAEVHWHTSDALITDLFADKPAAFAAGPTGDNAAPLPTAPAASPLAVPPDFLALCQSVVLHSDALLTLPRTYAEELARSMPLVVRELPLPVPPITIWMYWHADRDDDPVHRWLRARVCAGARQAMSGAAWGEVKAPTV